MGRKRHTPEQIITALREAEVGLARGKSVDEHTRECLAIVVARKIRSHDVLVRCWPICSSDTGLPSI